MDGPMIAYVWKLVGWIGLLSSFFGSLMVGAILECAECAIFGFVVTNVVMWGVAFAVIWHDQRKSRRP
jgi:hypothetical protein